MGACCSGRGQSLSAENEKKFKDALALYFWKDDDSQLDSAFKLLNTSGSGSLTSAEMEAKLIPMFREFKLGKKEIAEMIQEADTDKNGTVESAEFIAVLKKNKEEAKGVWGRLKLYDAIGGEAGIKAIVEKMYEKI